MQFGIVGCGGRLPGGGLIALVDSFPPWISISLRWNTTGSTVARVLMTQDQLNTGNVAWSYNTTGESGNVTFRSTAGAFGVIASNATACPSLEILSIDWSY